MQSFSFTGSSSNKRCLFRASIVKIFCALFCLFAVSANNDSFAFEIREDVEDIKERKIIVASITPFSGRALITIDGTFLGESNLSKGAIWVSEMPIPHGLPEKILSLSFKSKRGRHYHQISFNTSIDDINNEPIIKIQEASAKVFSDISLWRISRLVSGMGKNYINIFTANKDIIRNANVIHPGQSLSIPIDITNNIRIYSK